MNNIMFTFQVFLDLMVEVVHLVFLVAMDFLVPQVELEQLGHLVTLVCLNSYIFFTLVEFDIKNQSQLLWVFFVMELFNFS